MCPKLYPEEREAARIAFDRACDDLDVITPFQAVIALKDLDIITQSNDVYRMSKTNDISFELFCDIYETLKWEREKKELEEVVQESFEALGGKPERQGIIDMKKLNEVFNFFEFDMDIDDFLHGNTDNEMVYDDYSRVFGLDENIEK